MWALMRRAQSMPRPTTTLRAGLSSLRFYHGDAISLLGRLPAASVDVVVTSPPYNLGIWYRSYQDTLPGKSYLQWTNDWIGGVARVLTEHGTLFLNVGTKPTRPWTAMDVALEARQHFQLQNTIHWIKSIVIEADAAGARAGLDRDLAVGHYEPINSARFLNDCHEFIYHFTQTGRTPLERRALGVAYQDPSNVARWQAAAEGLRCRGNTCFIPYETVQDRERDRPHPDTFPTRLPRNCLQLHGLSRSTVVMNPFLRFASTAIACAEVGAAFIGIEIDRDYLDEAIIPTRAAIAARAARRRHRPVSKA